MYIYYIYYYYDYYSIYICILCNRFYCSLFPLDSILAPTMSPHHPPGKSYFLKACLLFPVSPLRFCVSRAFLQTPFLGRTASFL